MQRNRIINDCVKKKLDDELRENRLGWFGHVQLRPKIVLVRSDKVVDNGPTRTRMRDANVGT